MTSRTSKVSRCFGNTLCMPQNLLCFKVRLSTNFCILDFFFKLIMLSTNFVLLLFTNSIVFFSQNPREKSNFASITKKKAKQLTKIYHVVLMFMTKIALQIGFMLIFIIGIVPNFNSSTGELIRKNKNNGTNSCTSFSVPCKKYPPFLCEVYKMNLRNKNSKEKVKFYFVVEFNKQSLYSNCSFYWLSFWCLFGSNLDRSMLYLLIALVHVS